MYSRPQEIVHLLSASRIRNIKTKLKSVLEKHGNNCVVVLLSLSHVLDHFSILLQNT